MSPKKKKLNIYEPDESKQMTVNDDGSVDGYTNRGEITDLILKEKGPNGREHKITRIPEGTIIDTNPCRWYFIGSQWFYICG